MAKSASLVRSWRVGRWTVTLSIPALTPDLGTAGVVEWSPAMPGRPLTPTELAQYRAGRDAALAAFAREKGLGAAVVEAGRGLVSPSVSGRRKGGVQ